MAGELSAKNDSIASVNPGLNPGGFGSYLTGILPRDIATACGALRASMLQVRNISSVPIAKFAQVVANLELPRGLAVGGTSVPVNTALANSGLSILARGSGPNGLYTVSDFFGCVSGLPYNAHLATLNTALNDVVLANIYHELYLAITWAAATVDVILTTSAVPDGVGGFNYFYQITGVTLIGGGGGYGRGGSSPPIITISGTSGATAAVTGWTTTIDTATVATYGTIVGVTLTGAGANTLYGNGASATPPPPGITAAIEAPPTVSPGVIGPTLPTGYANTPAGTVGWPGMNAVVQAYIDQANARISVWSTSNPQLATAVNTAWNAIGTQLTLEQGARRSALYPLPVPKDPLQPLSQTPGTSISWVDALTERSMDTFPQGHAQTLEAIANWSTVGGQSIVAVMRQERNTARLDAVGIPLDTAIPITDNTINRRIDSARIANDRAASLTGGGSSQQPLGYYDSATNRYVVTTTSLGITTLDNGDSDLPGSFAGSEWVDLIPPQLNAAFISAQLTPATYNAEEAQIVVEQCNCDCWEQ